MLDLMEFTVRHRGALYVVTVDDEDYERVMAVGTWNLDTHGYVVRARTGERGLKLSRFILGSAPGDPPVDHRNGNKLDNTRGNLRPLRQLENTQNLAAINNRGRSRFRGVTWHQASGKWRAAGRSNRRYVSLGLYATEEEAAAVLVQWRLENLPHDERGRLHE